MISQVQQTLNWVKFYLSNRTQVIQINAITLHERGFVYGALQGSILGPLLQQSVLQIIGPLVNLSFKNLAFLIFIVCFHSKSDPSCTCATMKCYLSLFKTYFKLEVKSIIILLDIPSHTVLMPAEQKLKIYHLIPRTEIVELFTSLNNQVKQLKKLQTFT